MPLPVALCIALKAIGLKTSQLRLVPFQWYGKIPLTVNSLLTAFLQAACNLVAL